MKNSNFQFKNPRVKKFLFKTNDDFDKDSFEGFNIHHSINVFNTEDTNNAVVELSLSIGSNDCSTPFSIDATIYSNFRWENDTDTVDRLLRCNAPSLLLSYLRPIVANAVANAGFPRFDIPFMDFTDEQ